MGTAGGFESVSSRVGHLVGSRNELEPCNGQLLMPSSLASPRDPNPPAQRPGSPISPAPGRIQGDARVNTAGHLQVGLSSSILLSTSADVLQGVGSTSCNLLPNSDSSLAQSLAPLPQHLASIFADLTNAPASQPNVAGAESDLPSAATVSGSADGCDHMAFAREGLIESSIATSSGDQDAVMTVEHGKLEKGVSELKQELLEEGELEDGELSGGWESGEDDEDDDNADPMNFRDERHEEDEADADEEEGIVDYRSEGLTPVIVRFGDDGRANQATVGGFGNQLAEDRKKSSKRQKGKGALSRQRKRSRVEKEGSNESIAEVSVNKRQQGGHVTSTTKLESSSAGRKAGEKQRRLGCKLGEADTGPEEGEVIEEDNRGLLSQLVEEEVGLWTTDIGDEEIISSMIDSDEDGKKKIRAPISAERKLKKKVAFRRKRAEKEKELGIRRPRLPVNTFKPKVPLCKFYIKGRCTLGAKCTFSHDVVPVTKSDPCKFFMVNRCLKGDDCPFSHTLDTFPCKFWHTRGHCLDGSNCRFSHGPLTDDQRQNLAKRIEHDSKEQLNVPDIPTGFNNAPEESESEYMPAVNSSQNEALGWDVNPPQALNQDTAFYASTSIASQNNREVPSAAPRASFVANQSNVVLGEVNREEIQLTDTYKENPTVENAVLLAARKAASAAAVQAAGSTDKLLLSRSGSATSIAKSGSFGRGKEASAMDLLQASFGSDDRHDLSRNASSSSSNQAVSNTSTSSALALCRAGAGTGAAGGTVFPSIGPLSRAIPSSLARGSSFGHTRQVVPGNKASAMELIKASLGNEVTADDNTQETDFPCL